MHFFHVVVGFVTAQAEATTWLWFSSTFQMQRLEMFGDLTRKLELLKGLNNRLLPHAAWPTLCSSLAQVCSPRAQTKA
jgi:hypothetical protein